MQRCDYRYYRGKNRGQQCEIQTRAGRCHKHRKCIETAASEAEKGTKLQNDEVFGNSNVAPDIQPKGKVKSSIYLVTVNTNKTLESLSASEKKQFKDFIGFIFDKQNLIDNYIIDNYGQAMADILESIEVEYHFEISPQNNRLHCHAYVAVEHYGHIRLNIDDMRALAKKIFPTNIYINATATSDKTVAMKNYTRKNNGEPVKL